MNMGRFFACMQIALCVFCSIGYFISKDIRRGFYWLFAAGITAAVTF